jgi:hypothetical protein
MDTGTNRDPASRLDVPPTTGGCCGAIGALLFVGFFVALAVNNLADYSHTPVLGIIASVLWLALVAFVLAGGVYFAGGIGPSAIECLGLLSSRPFADVSRDGERVVIGFGYELFGRRFYYLRIDREQITSVVMNTGQASSLAGRDMDDWSVVLWYRVSGRVARTPPRYRDDEEVYIVGPARARERTAELFGAFVALLRSAGVELHPTERENEFRTSGAPEPPAPPAPDPSA